MSSLVMHVIGCWDLIGANLDVCDIILPTAPQNVSISGRVWNSSSINLTVEWSPPEQYAPDIIAYKIYIDDFLPVVVNGVSINY